MVGELAAHRERTGEEVTRLLLERGEQGGLQAIPPTLQQSLAARLDRLGEAREVAQIGAVLGRDFSYALLRAVAAFVDASWPAKATDPNRTGALPTTSGPGSLPAHNRASCRRKDWLSVRRGALCRRQTRRA